MQVHGLIQTARDRGLGDVRPEDYPESGGYPYFNIALFWGIPYDKVLTNDRDLKPVYRARIRLVQQREAQRRAGQLGSL